MGLFITAGEAHYMLGSVEGLIRSVKNSTIKLLATQPQHGIFTAACLAMAAHNNLETVNGYSPVQWAFGSKGGSEVDVSMLDDTDPAGIAQTELNRIEAEKHYLEAKIREKLSKLRRTLKRPICYPQIGEHQRAVARPSPCGSARALCCLSG